MPWNMPFESAETPGEASVTSELTEEERLSSGIFENRSRSTSVWPTGSASIMSPLVVVTSTVVLVAATCRVTFSASRHEGLHVDSLGCGRERGAGYGEPVRAWAGGW